MFLFTTPSAGSQDASQGAAAATAARTASAPAGVIEAIRQGAQSSGVGFDYLLATAQRESSLDPAAKAATAARLIPGDTRSARQWVASRAWRTRLASSGSRWSTRSR